MAISSSAFSFTLTSLVRPPHFVLIPLMASQGHMIPMVDTRRLLAKHGIMATIITTPFNAARFEPTIDRARELRHPIQVIKVHFPAKEAGLPESCENFDSLPSQDMIVNFFTAASMLQRPVEALFEELTPRPSCIISGMYLPWTSEVASKFRIPRLSFNAYSCFTNFCLRNIRSSKVPESVASDFEYFQVPGIPDCVELTRAQLPSYRNPHVKDFRKQVYAAEMAVHGVIMANTFQEMEEAYVEEYRKARGAKIWCIGPLSLCNKDFSDKVARGGKSSVSEHEYLKWLDSWQPETVIYACRGSICNLSPAQAIEIGLGLEASNRPFIWVVRAGGGSNSNELEKWIAESGFTERTKGRGLLIHGWAPQALILSHPSVGGFLTQCGASSTLDAICAGVPMITWPLNADNFLVERFIVHVVGIGVSLGVKVPGRMGLEQKLDAVVVKKDDVKIAVDKLMSEGKERDERRRRVRELSDKAKRAVEEGGSSHRNFKLMIQDIMEQTMRMSH